jgi:anti-sigma B factor antagonist
MRLGCVNRGDDRYLLLSGELDQRTAPALRTDTDALLAEQPRSIVVDVSDLDFIDSTGVAVLVSLFKRARDYGGEVVVTGASDQPLAIFRLLRLDRVFVRVSGSALVWLASGARSFLRAELSAYRVQDVHDLKPRPV